MEDAPHADQEALRRLGSLDDPTRRALYDHVARQPGPVTRDDASAALGLERATAAYHLDKLVEQGLLVASFARPAGRGGPGAGRPAKRYERTTQELSVSLPPRAYRLAAEILARAADRDPSGAVREALTGAAARMGEELVAEVADVDADVEDFLDAQGFEPYRDGEHLRLRNCPFHQLAREHTELVCGMNLAMLGAAVARLDGSVTARLDPAEDRCCVRLSPSTARAANAGTRG